MYALFRLDEATVTEVVEELGEPELRDSVRVTLRNLEKKGWVAHRRDGPRYVYRPAVPEEDAVRAAIDHLVNTFFDDDPAKALLVLLDRLDGSIASERVRAIRSAVIGRDRLPARGVAREIRLGNGR